MTEVNDAFANMDARMARRDLIVGIIKPYLAEKGRPDMSFEDMLNDIELRDIAKAKFDTDLTRYDFLTYEATRNATL